VAPHAPTTVSSGPLRPSARSLSSRLATVDWGGVETALWERGYARAGLLLRARECRGLAALFDRDETFRNRVYMRTHRFGEGEYRYFSQPLPPLVASLRRDAYPPLVAIANRWARALGEPGDYPETHARFLRACARAGQRRPTPLLLRYETGGYNCLHRDLYGPVVFPFQLLVVLSRPRVDYSGGELLLVEQRPRAQSVAEVVQPERGELVVFASHSRPVQGRRGHYRAPLRHGVSRLLRGERVALGIIFHDAT